MTPEMECDLFAASKEREISWILDLHDIRMAALRQAKRLLEAHTEENREDDRNNE